MAPPSIAVVLNVGLAHVGLLGSVEAVAAAKRELVEGLRPDGLAVLNADDHRVRAMAAAARRVRLYGMAREAQVRAERVRMHGLEGSAFRLLTPQGDADVYLRLPGPHNVMNALATAAVALEFGFDAHAVASALHGFVPPDHRMNLVQAQSGATLIDDCYNANPSSMQAALRTLGALPRGSRIAVLGDMLELGDQARPAHEEIGTLAGQTVDRLVVLGDFAGLMASAARRAGLPADRVVQAGSAEEAVRLLRPLLNAQARVLVKGSRGMHLEKVVDGLRAEP